MKEAAPKRGYGQFCGVARALEQIGDRWTLLIVRELMVAPSRYKDLREGLPGIATNLLADRLRSLESCGLVERRVVREGGIAYALTPRGAELRPVLRELTRWSTPLMAKGPGEDLVRPHWLVVALDALLSGRALPGKTVELDCDDVRITLKGTRTGVDVRIGAAVKPDAVVSIEPQDVLAVASGMRTLAALLETGSARATGNAALAERFLEGRRSRSQTLG